MSVIASVREALETHLVALPGLPVDPGGAPMIQWENAQFVPDDNGLWIRVTLMPVEPTGRTLGGKPYARIQGLFLVDVFSPQGDGPAQAEALADAVMEHFASGTRLAGGGVWVTLTMPMRGGGLTDSIWYQVPVTVFWYSHTRNI